MRPTDVAPAVAGWVGALLSSLCCLLPLAVILLGLGSGAFMAVTMQYRYVLIPTGALGVVAGLALHVRERRRCDRLGCPMAGRRLTPALLILAAVVVATAIVLDMFPAVTADLILWAVGDAGGGPMAPMGGMR